MITIEKRDWMARNLKKWIQRMVGNLKKWIQSNKVDSNNQEQSNDHKQCG